MAITFVGVGAQAVNPGAGDLFCTPALPAGVQEDDVLLIHAYARVDITAGLTSTGYTEIGRVTLDLVTTDMVMVILRKVAGASESNPQVNSSASVAPLMAYVSAYRGASTSTPEDATAVTATSTAATTWTPTGITTNTDGAWVVSFVCTPDDNALGLNAGNEQGFTGRATGADYDTIQQQDGAQGSADKEITSAGAVTNPTWEQTITGPDEWTGITVALKPAAGIPTGRNVTLDFAAETALTESPFL